ncbi:MAG: Phenylalanine--tRNA ligase beta subunit [Alphaproteobacteria bacterium MarineAlpha11_Bin1]|nr:MAG: Phenylalanine--tRNA ligase beta subunit [Alphaproteobacteria bacterium MarineAlpha11_Bin1]|tara:strand:+ start:7101 stop:9521 length:2421 start_codon:yes stop_codon:yes gene_type:complete
MKFTFDWLKEHLHTERPLSDIVEKLSMIGLEVEGVEDRAQSLASFRVALVVSAKKHPDADRLQVCMVDCGDGDPIQVVCGAPNARAGMKGVFAAPGSYIPGINVTLKKSKIRGEESNGMLLSEREMGLSDDHEGIVELPEDTEIGIAAVDVLGLSDPVIEIGLTPNRQDCAGVRGIARDLAAAGLGTMKPLDAPQTQGDFASPIQWQRDFPNDAQGACPLVVGRYFRGVENGPSPQWLQDRLCAIGLRPISALVDITNYVTFDLARPLHVFDAANVKGDITMRLAKDGEKVLALDGGEYELESDMTVIADDNGVEAIGGIMGGEASAVTENTTDVFLEVALFDPVRTATSGRKLGIMSDARYRFERGVDPESAFWGTHVATKMILDLCGGEASELTFAGEMPNWRRELRLRISRVASLGGLDVPGDEQVRILADLGFDPVDEGDNICTVIPSWRQDINGEADLAEEILRIRGYDDIPAVPLSREAVVAMPAWSASQRRESAARRILASRGMTEAVTFSFMKRKTAEIFGFDNEALAVDNPISADLDTMRPSILPNLLEAAQRNADRGYPDVALFEVGPIYSSDEEDGQANVATAIRIGKQHSRHWCTPQRDVDAWDAKADAYAALEAVGAPIENLQVTMDPPQWFHPGRAGVFRLGPNALASFGDIHPATLREMNIDGPAVGMVVNLHLVPLARKNKAKSGSGAARPLLHLSPFQAVHRDFAFVVDNVVSAGEILRAARSADKNLVVDASVFDVYEGDNVGEDKKSVAISVTLQPTEATLTDEKIEAVVKKITTEVKQRTGGVLRG